MPRGIDHIVHAVRDLEAAAASYRALGFTVGARNRHPWGTHNRIVQFPGCFIELLEVAEPEAIPPARPGIFSFGEFNQRFLQEGEGLSMLVLESIDAAADHAAFRAAGIGHHELFRFEREGRRADGSPVRVAFSLAFATDPPAVAGFFVCQQHYPENFWSLDLQRHANDVRSIAGVVLVAQEPAAHRAFLAEFTGVADIADTADGLTVHTPRGEVEVLTPRAYRARFRLDAPDVARGARLAVLRFIASRESEPRIVPPQAAHGACLAFAPARPAQG